MRRLVILGVLAGAPSAPLAAQVALHPATVEPAQWARFALQVVNRQESAIVSVRLEVPEAVTVLGTNAPPGWTFRLHPASDTTPQVIEWREGILPAGGFQEFAFLGRVMGDARRKELVFPVHLRRADGTERHWGRGSGAARPPTVQIRGSTAITAWGAAALGGAAFGIAVLALGVAVARARRASGGESGPDASGSS